MPFAAKCWDKFYKFLNCTQVIGLGLLITSIVFLIQVVGYQNPGLLYNNYPPYRGNDYYNVSYNLFGYQFDPIIAIASVGVAIGVFQFLGSFALCCATRVSVFIYDSSRSLSISIFL